MTRVCRLSLTDFRSYEALSWQPAAQILALAGPNGSGKTNLLEAISLLAPGRGLRGARLTALPRAGSLGFWAVSARIERLSRTFELGTGIAAGQPERRSFRLDGEAPSSQAEIAERFSAVWLTPQMDRLFTDGPAGRRRFLDRLTVALEPAHAREIASFEAAAVNHRRQLEIGGADADYLAIIEDSMARHAVAASAARLDLVDQLNLALGAGATAPFPAARLELLCPIADRLRSMPALAVEDWLRERYALAREADIVTPSPQRMDLLIADPARGLIAADASTGQQKIMLIGIVLAHAALIAERRGAPPVLLLDEPFTHLDAAHRDALKAALRDGAAQAFLTGTDAELFHDLGETSALWTVRESCLTPANGINSDDKEGA